MNLVILRFCTLVHCRKRGALLKGANRSKDRLARGVFSPLCTSKESLRDFSVISLPQNDKKEASSF